MEKEKELVAIGKIYTEKQLSENQFIRTFNSDIDELELEWHRDREDRIVESINSTNWKFQIDNLLPQDLNSVIYIPKETFHRLIKGDGNLTIKITKLYHDPLS